MRATRPGHAKAPSRTPEGLRDQGFQRTRWAPSRETLRALAVVGGDIWAAGDHATLHHYVGAAGSWQTEQIPELPEDAALRGVWTDGGRLVVVGAAGVLFERVAGTWSSSAVANGVALNAVWSDGAETWAVGDGGLEQLTHQRVGLGGDRRALLAQDGEGLLGAPGGRLHEDLLPHERVELRELLVDHVGLDPGVVIDAGM